MSLSVEMTSGLGPEYAAQLGDMLKGNETADAAAITEVCFRETWGNHLGYPDLWASCWLHSETSSLTGVLWDAGLFTWTGWPAIEAAIGPDAEARALGRLSTMPFRHEGHQTVVSGNMAWSRFTETNWHASDSQRNTGYDVMQYRVLERHDGLWKIVHLIFLPIRTAVLDRAYIQIDGSGRVKHISAAVKDAMTTTGLTISAGRLRAVRSAWDHDLQATIVRLNRSTGLAELSTGSVAHTGLDWPIARECPVMLGEDENGGQRYCILMIQDGKVLVSLDGPASIDRRLRVANTIYGLSDAQLRLAREIVSGSSLATAASMLGISLNTARTHRDRIFAKIGVNNQAALVRCLLSVSG